MGCRTSKQASVQPEPGSVKSGAVGGAVTSGQQNADAGGNGNKEGTQAFAVELWKSSAFDALESILGSPEHIRRHFAAFLADEFSENNLEFWDRVQRLRTLDANTPEARAEALAIYHRFVKSGSADEVNLPSRLRDASAYTQEMHVQLLTMAQREILLMMSLDAFPRFLRSHHCDAMMAALTLDPQQSWSPAGAVPTGFHVSGGHGNASLAAALGANPLAMPAGKGREGSMLSGYSRAASLEPEARIAVTAPGSTFGSPASGRGPAGSSVGSGPFSGAAGAGGSAAHGDAALAAHAGVVPVSAGSNASDGSALVAGGSAVAGDGSGQVRANAGGARAALSSGADADGDPTAPPAKTGLILHAHSHAQPRGAHTHASGVVAGAAAALAANSSSPVGGSGVTPAPLYPPATGAAAALAQLRSATVTGASSLTGSMDSTWTSASRAPESSADLSQALRNARDQLRSGAGRWLDVFKDVAEFIPSCIVIADMNLPGVPIVYANPAFFTTTGYPKHEVLGRNCRFLQGAETSKEDIEKLRAAIREGKRTNLEILNYKKDGTKFRNFLSITPVFEARKRRPRLDGAGGVSSMGGSVLLPAGAAGAASGAASGRGGSGASAPSSRADAAVGAGAGAAGGAGAMPLPAAEASKAAAAAAAIEMHTGLALSHGGAPKPPVALSSRETTNNSPTASASATTSTYDGMEEVEEPGPRKMAFFIGLQFEVLNDAMITGRLLRHEALLRMLPQQVAL